MKRFFAVIMCCVALFTSVHAYADGVLNVSQPKVDSNVIKYSVSAENTDNVRVISALYAAGTLTAVNTGIGDKAFYAPANKGCTIKIFALDKTSGDIVDTKVFGLTTSQSPYKETLIIFLSDADLETAANYIHDEVGGDMAEIVPNMVLNPSGYDTVFIGYTSDENGSLEPSVQKIFDTYDFGKATIVPFCLGEVRGTDIFISILEPDALVHEALNVKGAALGDIKNWLEELN